MSPTLTAACIATSVLLGAAPALAQKSSPRPEPELALQLDFVDVEGTVVRDVSGHGCDATIERATIVADRKKTAVKLDGRGQLTIADATGTIRPERRALSVGAMVKPAAEDGVVVSMGDAKDGFSLYLRGGVPHFAVRSGGALHTVAASDRIEMNAWSHVVGVIGPKGELTLVVNTMPDGTLPGAMLSQAPAERLSIGADPGSPVGDYAGPLGWRGLLGNVRLYWGEVGRGQSAALLGDWADRPMCGMSR